MAPVNNRIPLSLPQPASCWQQVRHFVRLSPEFRADALREMSPNDRKRALLGLSPQQKASTLRGMSKAEAEEELSYLEPWDREATEAAIAFAEKLDGLDAVETAREISKLPLSNVITHILHKIL